MEKITREQIKEMTTTERANLVDTTTVQLNETYIELRNMIDEVRTTIGKELSYMTTHNIEISKPYIFQPFDGTKGSYEVVVSVSFLLNEVSENDKYATDFGSSFDLTFYENHINVNYGTIGTFSSEYIYQVARINLLSQIFSNEETLVEAVKKVVDMSHYERRHELDRIICTVERVNNEEELEAQRNEVIDNLVVGALYKQTEYHEGEDCGWYFRVTAITDKTVTCDQLHRYYDWCKDENGEWHYTDTPAFHDYNTKRIRRDDFISRIMSGRYNLVKEN